MACATAYGVPNTGLQISTYLASHTPTATQLFTIWAGANDFLAFGQTDPSIPVANIGSEITTLANAGAKFVMVPNLPLLGDLPATNMLPQAQRDGLNQLTLAFNSLLNTELGQLRQSLGITIYEPDINGFVQNVLANPAQYGFTDVTTDVLDDGATSAKGYLFWDSIHPTTVGHQEVADVAFASMVPEPSSMVLVLSGLAAVVRRLEAATRSDRVNPRASSIAFIWLQVEADAASVGLPVRRSSPRAASEESSRCDVAEEEIGASRFHPPRERLM